MKKPAGLFGYTQHGYYKDIYIYFDSADKVSPVSEVASLAFSCYGIGGAQFGPPCVIRGKCYVVRLEPDPKMAPPPPWTYTPLISPNELFETLLFFRDGPRPPRELAQARDEKRFKDFAERQVKNGPLKNDPLAQAMVREMPYAQAFIPRRQFDPHDNGAEVIVIGLKKATHLNGKTGVVLTFNAEKQRYAVMLRGKATPVWVKHFNLKLLESVMEAPVAGRGASAAAASTARPRHPPLPSSSFPVAMVGSRIVVDALADGTPARKGTIVGKSACDGQDGWDILFDGEKHRGTVHSTRIPKYRKVESASTFFAAVVRDAPDSVVDAIERTLSDSCEDLHLQLQFMSRWASDAQVEAALAKPMLVDALVSNLNTVLIEVGMQCSMSLNPGSSDVFLCRCVGCNMPHDNGSCHHPGGPSVKRLPVGHSLHAAVHRASQLMAIARSLLAHPLRSEEHKDALLERLVPDGIVTSELLEEMNRNPMAARRLHQLSPLALVGVLDNCSRPFPKLAGHAASLLSVLIARRPLKVLSMLDPRTTTTSLVTWLDSLFGRVRAHSEACRVELAFGAQQVLDLVPLLYHLGDWPQVRPALEKVVAPFVASILGNLMHHATEDYARDDASGRMSLNVSADDRPFDCELFPCLSLATFECAFLYGAGEKMMKQRPLTFAAACLVEVLGRWQCRGVNVSGGRLQLGAGSESVATLLDDYSKQVACLSENEPTFAHVATIYEALLTSKKPRFPKDEQSLIRGPLRACRVCCMPGCNARTTSSGEDLLTCGGGCGMLARYCSRAHQKKHWKIHKKWCKRRKKK
jgi:hypothetical protein